MQDKTRSPGCFGCMSLWQFSESSVLLNIYPHWVVQWWHHAWRHKSSSGSKRNIASRTLPWTRIFNDVSIFGEGGAQKYSPMKQKASWILLNGAEQPNIIVVSTVSKTYVRRPWLIVSINIGYSFNVHAWLPLRVAMSKHCEEPGLSFQMLEGGSPIGHNVVSCNVLTDYHDTINHGLRA